jgi:hypothetical protein
MNVEKRARKPAAIERPTGCIETRPEITDAEYDVLFRELQAPRP